MSEDVMEKFMSLPKDKQKEVEDFVDDLLSKFRTTTEQNSSVFEKRRSNLGRFQGKIWMADDFNETPEDFKDYI